MKLSMLYATLDDRIISLIENLPSKHSCTEIIIIHQAKSIDKYNSNLEKIAKRNDIYYYHSNNNGVARSRNLAIEKATGDIILFCDDDITYMEGFQDKVIQSFSDHNNTEFITFAYKNTVNGPWLKRFKLSTYRHTNRTILGVGTIQVACRRETVIQYNIKFPEDMGAGTTYFLCDEPVFLSKFLKHDLPGIYIPYVLCFHPEESSGSTFNHINAFNSRILCFTRIFGDLKGRIYYLAYILKNIRKYNSSNLFFESIKLAFTNPSKDK
ncbi:glycosyltransferase [Providencia sp. PROV188]|uniref:glycosyltransferase n=1 Tax=Providencia sp. PROV188 TaxID=2939731 RepID=UPI0022DDE882|nr:glycosyltransferase [Providencia sp. PROV188]WBM60750.1 glycosyltransferase [Providencia sp. PROV188]